MSATIQDECERHIFASQDLMHRWVRRTEREQLAEGLAAMRITTDTPQFFLTAPAPCPYLDGRMERKVFTHLVGDSADQMNDILTQGGFRRSQNICLLYTSDAADD